MGKRKLPIEIPPLYRGGHSLTFRYHEVKLDRRTGLLKTTHGVSVDAAPEHVAQFGGAYVVQSIPEGLKIIQRGRRPTHYEIAPTFPVTSDQYQSLLDQVELEPFEVEQ